jgi:hypothetical protein
MNSATILIRTLATHDAMNAQMHGIGSSQVPTGCGRPREDTKTLRQTRRACIKHIDKQLKTKGADNSLRKHAPCEDIPSPGIQANDLGPAPVPLTKPTQCLPCSPLVCFVTQFRKYIRLPQQCTYVATAHGNEPCLEESCRGVCCNCLNIRRLPNLPLATSPVH